MLHEYRSLDCQLCHWLDPNSVFWLYRDSALKLGGISILGLPRLYFAGL
jgi:hypothetical protein